jgi:hypothetical protein
MPLIPPGGRIPSGVGGRIYVNSLGNDQDPGSPYFDLARWHVDSIYHNAECTHSGCYGSAARRQVLYDFRFQAEVPFDIDNPPEMLLGDSMTVCIRFNFGDVNIDPAVYGMDAEQKYYFAPSCVLDNVQTILDATGRDVIRQVVQGSANSLLFFLPDQMSALQNYRAYLNGRKWAT